MSVEGITTEELDLAQQFYTQGMEQFDHVAYGEADAKKLGLIGFVGRGGILLSGVPGGAKSLLTDHIERIISDIAEDEVSIVPIDAELKAIQLVGGEMPIIKDVSSNGQQWTEKLKTTVPGLITPRTKVVKVDEATRTSPYALNATLPIPEEKRLVTTAGNVPLPNFQLMVSNLNPSETKEATFKLPTAYGSRPLGGAIMGRDITSEHKQAMMQQIFPSPENMKPIASIADLNKIRAGVSKLMIPETELALGERLVDTAKVKLKQEYGIVEENRPLIQVGQLAKIIGAFNGRKPNAEDVREALRFVLAARIGALVSSKDGVAELEKTYQAVLSEAA